MPTATPLSQWPVAQSPSRPVASPNRQRPATKVKGSIGPLGIGHTAHTALHPRLHPPSTVHLPRHHTTHTHLLSPPSLSLLLPSIPHTHPSFAFIHSSIPPPPTLLTLPNLVSHTHSTHRHHIGNNTSAHARNGTDDACRLLGPRRRPVTLFLSLPLCLNHHACAWPTVHLYASINDSAWHCPFRLTRWSVGLFAGGLLSRRLSTPISETSPPLSLSRTALTLAFPRHPSHSFARFLSTHRSSTTLTSVLKPCIHWDRCNRIRHQCECS